MLTHGANTLEEPLDLSFAWYALYTRHQHEKTVAHVLISKGFETFLPVYSAVHRWKDRVKQVSLPLFPCYVFLRGPLDRWLPVLTTPGVHSVVGFGGQPAMIPRSEIEAIRRVVESPLKAEPHPFIKCGDRVRIKVGPLQGLEGSYSARRISGSSSCRWKYCRDPWPWKSTPRWSSAFMS